METQEILDTSSLMEIKKGLTTIFSAVEYPKAVNYDIEILWPEKEDYILAVKIMAALYSNGNPIPAIDVLISGMCINRGMQLRTKDNHFLKVKEIQPNFLVEVE